MSHKPLSKTQSAHSFFQQIHTQTFMITHPMYQQQWPQETFRPETNVHLHPNTQSSFSHTHCKVPLHRAQPVSFGSLRKDRERTREDLNILSQSPHDNPCCDQLRVQHSERCNVRKNIHHRNLTRVHSSPGTFNRSLPLHLSSPLAQEVKSTSNYTTGRKFWVFKKKACDLYHSQIMLNTMIIGIYSHMLHAAQELLSLKQRVTCQMQNTTFLEIDFFFPMQSLL